MRPIDADALKTHVCNMCDDGQRECKGDESCAILCWINDMPTIEAEPIKYGRWEDIPGMERTVFCSECLAAANKELANKYICCPFCGARMNVNKGKEENENTSN